MLTVLVICTGNSCRSVLGEALFNHLGTGRIQAFSAGSHPKGFIKPKAIEILQKYGLPTHGLKSQSWDEYTHHPVDFIITVCDQAAGEVCPIYPSNATHIHWGLSEPSHTQKDINLALEHTYKTLEQRITKMLDLPLENMTAEQRHTELNTIKHYED